MAQHQVVLTWTASPDMPNPIPAGDGYNIFKNLAPGVPGSTPINSTPVQATTYTDTNVVAGSAYYYFVTAVIGGNQSADSVLATSNVVPIFPPSGLTALAS